MHFLRHAALIGVTGASLASAFATSTSAAGVAAADGLAFKAFVRENDQAMETMMAAMTIQPTGDVDADFTAMMIPHHQGAIDMAQAELRHGRNEQLRRIAQEIVVEQQQEIDAMQLALGRPVSSHGPAPTQGDRAQSPAIEAASAMHHHSSH